MISGGMDVERLRNAGREVLLFLMGGMGYFCLELLWRGWSHWTMVLVGGLCFIGVGRINEVLDWDTPLVLQALIGTAVITVVEFASGCVLNLWLGLNIWDYSDLPLNVLGQVCLLYAVLWYFLALPVIVVDDYLRWRLCGGSWPRYRLFRRKPA